jgi:hypothetical protein
MKEGSDDSCNTILTKERTALDRSVVEKPADLLEQEFVTRQRINNWTRSSAGGIKPIVRSFYPDPPLCMSELILKIKGPIL